MKIKLILTGSTAMVGEAVLHECLQHDEVEDVLVINRKSCGITTLNSGRSFTQPSLIFHQYPGSEGHPGISGEAIRNLICCYKKNKPRWKK